MEIIINVALGLFHCFIESFIGSPAFEDWNCKNLDKVNKTPESANAALRSLISKLEQTLLSTICMYLGTPATVSPAYPATPPPPARTARWTSSMWAAARSPGGIPRRTAAPSPTSPSSSTTRSSPPTCAGSSSYSISAHKLESWSMETLEDVGVRFHGHRFLFNSIHPVQKPTRRHTVIVHSNIIT